MDVAAGALDKRAIAVDHGRYLLTLVRMDQEYDLVMSHE
jgi:hypothetical protein